MLETSIKEAFTPHAHYLPLDCEEHYNQLEMQLILDKTSF